MPPLPSGAMMRYLPNCLPTQESRAAARRAAGGRAGWPPLAKVASEERLAGRGSGDEPAMPGFSLFGDGHYEMGVRAATPEDTCFFARQTGRTGDLCSAFYAWRRKIVREPGEHSAFPIRAPGR